jgi:hypothetical protein
MARSTNAPCKGRIQMRKTTPSICSHPACNARPVHTVGSTTDLTALKPDFRFTPESGLRADIAPCPVRAKTGSRNSCSIRCACPAPDHTSRRSANRPRQRSNSTSYTLALSRCAAMGKASSVLLVYFPRALLTSVIRASRAASLACDTGPANGEPAT